MTADFDVEYVLSQLTVDEKIGLLAGIDFWHTFPVKRLGVPSLRFSDGPNGIRGTKFFNSVPSGCFPCGTGLAATFDKELLRKAGRLMGEEAKHKGAHVILGPTINIQRGPLGGRGFESFSEDPYLTGLAATAIIKGIQDEGIAATIKHFVCNDLEDDRNSSNSVLSERALREIYLEPFRLALKDSNPKALMTSYNKVNGEHASQSKRLLQTILRDEWEWDGTIMSDWYGTYTNNTSIENGLDLEMPGPTNFRRIQELKHMISTKELHIKDVDARVKSVLNLVKYALKSGVPENGAEDTTNNTPETSALLRKLAQDSIVLLKNEDNVLPLKKSETVAVIGPNAKYPAYCGGGSASLRAYYTTTPFDSITEKLDGKKPPYSVGANGHRLLPGLASNLINPVTGKAGYNLKFYKEPSDKAKRTLFDEYNLDISTVFLIDYYNDEVKDDLYYIDFEGDFTPEESGEYEFSASVIGTAQVFVEEKLVVDNKTVQRRGNSFFNSGSDEVKGKIDLVEGKTYKIKIEFGSRPTFTIAQGEASVITGGGGVNLGLQKVIAPEEEIKNAVAIAKSVDKVVLNIGLNQEWESEGFDRTHMDLVGVQNELIEAVLEANPNTVIVNQSGTPVAFPWLSKAKALVHAWYGGNEGGNAIADILYGDANPSGKLSLTFPYLNIDNPAYLHFKTERGRVWYTEDIFVGYRFYEKLDRKVAFPFGFGLSYSEFEISNLNIKVDEVKDKLEVNVQVKNIGKLAGSEVVQIYIGKKDSDVIRPVKVLKGFEKVLLKAGAKETVTSSLSLKESVSFFDEYQEEWSVQSGEYQVYVGNSSDNATTVGTFSVEKAFFWLGN